MCWSPCMHRERRFRSPSLPQEEQCARTGGPLFQHMCMVLRKATFEFVRIPRHLAIDLALLWRSVALGCNTFTLQIKPDATQQLFFLHQQSQSCHAWWLQSLCKVHSPSPGLQRWWVFRRNVNTLCNLGGKCSACFRVKLLRFWMRFWSGVPAIQPVLDQSI